jgi:GNAT superfamily N-acetyltransferase
VNVIIRTATSDDADGIAELRLMWERSRSGAVGDAVELSLALASWIEAHRETVIGKVAEEDGRLVGMAWLAIIDRVPVPTRYDRRSGEVQSVYVDPQYRSSGIGRALMDSITAEGNSLGLSRIVLHSSHEGAEFYRRLGWVNSEFLLEDVPTVPVAKAGAALRFQA